MKKFAALIMSLILIFSFVPLSLAADSDKPFDNSNFFTYGDYTIHYRTYDSSENKNQIMLIHGFCLSTASLEGIAAEYQKAGYDVVTVDVPNFGYSSRETSDTEFLSREEVIGALMAELGGTWIVGGHSMGGGIAINLACDYSDIVTGLVLFAPQTSNEASGFMAKFSASCIAQAMYNMILAVALRMPFMVRMLVDMSFSSSEYAKAYDLTRISAPLSLEGTGAGITIMTSHTRGSDLSKLSALDIPCAIITAANDKVAMADNLQAIIDNAPEGYYTYEFSEGGHMMMEYAPEAVAEHTLPIIAKCK
ncbi:MAG: alpha/beta hydrolase [Clostridia bacterium]|nr:alpha/beta hydrolase [Clostridia bacterium]